MSKETIAVVITGILVLGITVFLVSELSQINSAVQQYRINDKQK